MPWNPAACHGLVPLRVNQVAAVCLSSFTGRNLAQREDLPEKPVSLRGPRSPTNASVGRLLIST
jgi:hypothetical protein